MSVEQAKLRAELDELSAEGRFCDMVPLAARMVELLGSCCGGSNRPEYVVALDELGGLHRNLGNYEDSLVVYQEALRLGAVVFGSDDPNYATTLNNVAGLFRLMGKWQRSEVAFGEAYGIYERTLGPNHFLTVSALNNLGLLRQDQGRPADAVELHRDCLDRLGYGSANALARATTLNNLAGAYRSMDRLEEAEPLMLEALDLYESEVGRRHPLYIGEVNNLASLDVAAGRLSAARRRLEWVAERCRVAFGPRSANTSAVLSNLASVYERIGDTEAAAMVRSELAAAVEPLDQAGSEPGDG